MVLIKVTLDWERDTKRYHVYRAPEGTMIPDRIYVPRNEAIPVPPQQVTVTVEA